MSGEMPTNQAGAVIGGITFLFGELVLVSAFFSSEKSDRPEQEEEED